MGRGYNVWFSLLFLLVLSGCVSTPKTLDPQISSQIKKIGVVTFAPITQLNVIDHTGAGGKTYGGYQYGAVGVLIETAIVESERATKIKKSLGGDPEDLKTVVSDLSIDEIVSSCLAKRLSKLFEVSYQEDLKVQRNEISKEELEGCFRKCNEKGIDSLLTVTYEWGLAAYTGENPSAAIDAEIQLWDVKNKKILFKQLAFSERLFRKNRSLEELKQNNGKMFREDINQAADSVALQIASQFGIDKDEAENKRTNDFYYYAGITCDKPYTLTQDCSGFSGPKRTITINGNKLKISGSEDGHIILLISDNFFWHYAADSFTFGGTTLSSNANNKALELVENELVKNKIKIVKKIKVLMDNGINGYFIELDGDGYSILKTYSE